MEHIGTPVCSFPLYQKQYDIKYFYYKLVAGKFPMTYNTVMGRSFLLPHRQLRLWGAPICLEGTLSSGLKCV